MKIHELISRLERHPNKDAEISIDANMINPDEVRFDSPMNLEIFDEDNFYKEFIELKLFPKEEMCEADKNNNLWTFLYEMELDEIDIKINVKNGIYIMDKDGGMLREIEFNSKYSRLKAIGHIIDKIQRILRNN